MICCTSYYRCLVVSEPSCVVTSVVVAEDIVVSTVEISDVVMAAVVSSVNVVPSVDVLTVDISGLVIVSVGVVVVCSNVVVSAMVVPAAVVVLSVVPSTVVVPVIDVRLNFHCHSRLVYHWSDTIILQHLLVSVLHREQKFEHHGVLHTQDVTADVYGQLHTATMIIDGRSLASRLLLNSLGTCLLISQMSI